MNILNIHSRILLTFAALFGASSVILAAVGAHGLQDSLVAKGLFDTFNKAVDYAMYGGVTLLGLVALQQILPKTHWFISGYLIAIGTSIFSVTLFLYTMMDMTLLTQFTPWGGTLLILGWLSIAVLAWLHKNT